jgi:hypothetical protein
MPNDDDTVSLLTLLLNPTAEDHPFALPAPTLPGRILLNTAQPETGDVDVKDQKVIVRSRSAVLVYSRLERAPQ